MARPPKESASTGRIVVCTTCVRGSRAAGLGARLAERLRDAFRLGTVCVSGAGFEVHETACMAGCTRPCTIAYQAPGKTSYLFGDIDPEADLDTLLQFAGQYAASADGWTREAERPAGLRNKTLARMPAIPIDVSQRAGADR